VVAYPGVRGTHDCQVDRTCEVQDEVE
jgi:hypothetical protein